MLCKEKILKDLNKVGFKDDVLQLHPRFKNRHYSDFITKEETIRNTSFDISQIIGSDHSNYAEKTWEYCLYNLKRQDRLDSLRCDDEQPSILYYTDINYRENSVNDPWSIDVVNKKAYITQGNHRSIISKFLSSLQIIQSEQFGLDYVTYIDYDEKGLRRYDKFLDWFETLPKIIRENIDLTVTSEVLSEQNNIKLKNTVYKLETGYYCDKFLDRPCEPIYSKFKSFLLFRKEVFNQVRYLKTKYKFYLVLIELYSKMKQKDVVTA